MDGHALTLVVADDHPLFRSALLSTLRRCLPAARVIEADSLEALRRCFSEEVVIDLVLLDLRMPGARGFSSLMELRAEHPEVPVVVVSAADEGGVARRARDLGASAFIPKSAGGDTIALALRQVLEGRTWFPIDTESRSADDPDRALARRLASLTPQQLRVLQALGAGRLNKQIAGDLDVTEATVKAHMTAILRKLGLVRRTQAALIAHRLLQDDGTPLWSEEFSADDPGAIGSEPD